MKLFPLLLTLIFSGCQTGQSKPDIFYVPGPQPDVMSVDDCGKACQNLRNHNCDLGFAVNANNQRCDEQSQDKTCITCEIFCKETIQNFIWLDTNCVAEMTIMIAPACEEIEQCALRENR